MGDSQKMKQLIKKLTKEEFRIPDEANVIKLRELNIPDYFVDFVIDFEPVRRTFIGNVRLLPIAEIIEENKDYVPGADVYPLGFTVFASTITGDAFCFHMNANNKLNEHDIYLVSHEELFENKDANFVISKSDFVTDSFVNLIEENIRIEEEDT